MKERKARTSEWGDDVVIVVVVAAAAGLDVLFVESDGDETSLVSPFVLVAVLAVLLVCVLLLLL